MTIRMVYTTEPAFPATDQHPQAIRYQIGAYWVDAVGNAPTQADVDAIVSPPALSLSDRVDMAVLKILFNQENRIRVLEGRAAVTAAQYRTVLIALLGG